MNTINIYGTEKEIEFVRVNKEDGTLRVYFTDKTFVLYQDITIDED